MAEGKRVRPLTMKVHTIAVDSQSRMSMLPPDRLADLFRGQQGPIPYAGLSSLELLTPGSAKLNAVGVVY